MVLSNQNRCRRNKRQGLCSTMSQISKKIKNKKNNWWFHFSQLPSNYIDANKAVHCFQMLTSSFSKLLVQLIVKEFILQISRIRPPRKSIERTTVCWFRCTTDPLRRQCITVMAHKRYMQLKKNFFFACSNVRLYRYLSITDESSFNFAQNVLFKIH